MAIVSTLYQAAPAWVIKRPILGSVGTLLLIVFIWRLIWTIRQYYRLRHFKGPPLAAFSILWHVKTVAGPRADLDYWEAVKKYGPIARIGPNDLITGEVELVRRTLSVRTNYIRANYYEAFRFDQRKDTVLTHRDEKKHMNLRSKMSPGYSGREVENVEKKIDNNILAFVDLLRKYATSGERMDFGRKPSYLTLDILADLAFGKPFGFMEMDTDLFDYIQITGDTMTFSQVLGAIPWALKLLQLPLINLMLPSPSDSRGIGKFMFIANKEAAERFGPDRKVQKDMLGSFVAHGLTEEEAKSEILLQIIAGSDTSATNIRTTMLYIVTNPLVLSRLRAEIAATENITRPVITDAESRLMPYLQAVIKEGLRIWPPATGWSAKEVPKQGDTYNGVFIPGGTRLGYSFWAIFRNQDLWGEDANEFRPERWLDASPKQLAQMDSTLELIFSSGRSLCLGKPIALTELNKIFVELLLRFDFVLCDPLNPWKVKNAGVYSQWDFWMRVYERKTEH